MSETHTRRMTRLQASGAIDRTCRAHDITFGDRCMNCGYTPPDHKATLFSPRLDKEHA